VILQNKDGINYTLRLPEVVQALQKIKDDFIVDSEATYINPDSGEEEFSPGTQRRCATHFPDPLLRQQYPITMQVFDILMLNGEDLTKRPFWERKETLEKLLDGCSETLRYVPYTDKCEKAWEKVKQQEREGLMLKEFESPYRQCYPKRSWLWLKLKNWRYRECFVAGYTPGKNSRAYFFGSLVLADKDGNFRGCVGSGFNDWELRRIKDLFSDAKKIEKPFSIGEPYTAVDIDLKVRVKHYKITASGVFRFPIFDSIVE